LAAPKQYYLELNKWLAKFRVTLKQIMDQMGSLGEGALGYLGSADEIVQINFPPWP